MLNVHLSIRKMKFVRENVAILTSTGVIVIEVALCYHSDIKVMCRQRNSIHQKKKKIKNEAKKDYETHSFSKNSKIIIKCMT